MEQRIKELGAYCVEHDISLDDLKQIRKELRTEKLKNESLNNEHFKRFLSLKNKQIVSGNLTIDFFMSSVKKRSRLLSIHESELLILQLLMANPHKTLKDKEILNILEAYGYSIGLKSLIVYVSRISHKIGKTTKQESYIKRHWKQGYYWNAKVSVQEESA